MTEIDVSFGNFDSDFQDLVLACWIRHPERFIAYGSILNPKSFSGVHSTIAAQVLQKHYDKTGEFPAWRLFKQLTLDEAARLETDREEIKSYLGRLLKIDTKDCDSVVEQVRDFMRERAILAAIRTTLDSIDKGKEIPRGELIKPFEEAIMVGQNLDDVGYVLHADIDKVVDKVTERGYGLRTGNKMFDTVWKHGWMPGWLVILLAPPKRWKTLTSINTAMNVVGPTIGRNVFYYSCEISQELATTRMLSNLTGLSQDYMFDNPEDFKRAAHEAKENQLAGYMVIKGFSAGTTTIQDIKAHALTIKRQLQIDPHLIVIDYAETIAPSVRKKQDHREQADIYTEARALGHFFKCPVLMPDRCNAETVGMAVPNMRSFQGAFQKAGIVDAAIGLCATDEEYQQNVVRGFVFINRHGKAYQHWRGTVDAESMQISFDEEIPYEPEEDSADNGKKKRGGKPKSGSVPDELQ